MPQNGGPIRPNGGGERRGPRPGAPRLPNPPPGGAAGAAQQTPATQFTNSIAFAPGFGRGPSRPRHSKKRSARTAPRRRTKRSRRSTRRSKKRAHLVKGSAAAKRFMAKLRRMQKRRR